MTKKGWRLGYFIFETASRLLSLGTVDILYDLLVPSPNVQILHLAFICGLNLLYCIVFYTLAHIAGNPHTDFI